MTYLLSEQNSKINISLFSLKGKQRAVKPPHSSRLALKWLPCKILYNTHTRTYMRVSVCVGVCCVCAGCGGVGVVRILQSLIGMIRYN